MSEAVSAVEKTVINPVAEAPKKRKGGVQPGQKRGPMVRKTIPYDIYRLDLSNGALLPVEHDQYVTAADGSKVKGFAKPVDAVRWGRLNAKVTEPTSFRVFKMSRGVRFSPPEAVTKVKVTNELS